jgi:NAD(P)-dependent dehydrogenase (short-subunit alcohol dehydrogenase family)
VPEYASLEGKVAWVTGAGRGTGLAIAEGLASRGVAVLLQARSREEVEAAAEKIRANGGQAEALVGSVTSTQAAAEAVRTVMDSWGRLDILVNNAGISPVMARTEELSDEAWSAVVDTNLSGVFYTCRAAATVMLPRRRGSVINISSVHGTVGFPRLAAYSASKGAVELFTKTLALEWADRGVRVNAVAPGYLATRMTEGLRASDHHAQAIRSKIPLGRFGTPEEVVGAVAYLGSDEASYVTGSIMAVDGGWTAQ